MAVNITFHGVTSRAFESLGRIVENGVGCLRKKDTLQYQGVTARYAYNPGTKDLTVEIIERPPIVSDAYIVGWIVQTLASLGAN
jgi:hypothetical protein